MTMQAQIEGAEDSRHSTAADFSLDEILVANRGDDAVVQIVGHDRWGALLAANGDYGPAVERAEVRRPMRPISSAT
jgi:hypothetical protein